MRFRWPWRDPDPLPPEDNSEVDRIHCEAERRRAETLGIVKRRHAEVAKNHFADDVKEALGL